MNLLNILNRQSSNTALEEQTKLKWLEYSEMLFSALNDLNANKEIDKEAMAHLKRLDSVLDISSKYDITDSRGYVKCAERFIHENDNQFPNKNAIHSKYAKMCVNYCIANSLITEEKIREVQYDVNRACRMVLYRLLNKETVDSIPEQKKIFIDFANLLSYPGE